MHILENNHSVGCKCISYEVGNARRESVGDTFLVSDTYHTNTYINLYTFDVLISYIYGCGTLMFIKEEASR